MPSLATLFIATSLKIESFFNLLQIDSNFKDVEKGSIFVLLRHPLFVAALVRPVSYFFEN